MRGECLQLVAAVTELVVAQLLYLQWVDPRLPTYVYLNSTGTSRADGETVRFPSHPCLLVPLHESSPCCHWEDAKDTGDRWNHFSKCWLNV